MSFDIFDPNAELWISAGNLPHWYQAGVTYFITFRTEDSVPGDLMDAWCSKRTDWLRRRGIASNDPGWRKQFEGLPEAIQHEFHNIFSREFMAYLDRGLGECVLRRAELSKIVADSLLHFDHQQYEMGDFVVMPNHVHLLVCLRGETGLEAQCYSWKKYSAGKINKLLGRKGRFWQEESFDHLVRSPNQFVRFQRYIKSNPEVAGLKSGEYCLYSRESM